MAFGMLANIPHQNDIIKNGSGEKTPLLIKLKQAMPRGGHSQYIILGIMSTRICLHLEDISGPGISNFIRTWGIKWYQMLHGFKGHLNGWRWGWGCAAHCRVMGGVPDLHHQRTGAYPSPNCDPNTSPVITTVCCKGGGWMASVRKVSLRCTFQQRLSPVNQLETVGSD